MTPWWVKVAAKIVLGRLPARYSVWQQLGLFRHGQMDRADYALNVFNLHVKRCGLQGNLTGKRSWNWVLETALPVQLLPLQMVLGQYWLTRVILQRQHLNRTFR